MLRQTSLLKDVLREFQRALSTPQGVLRRRREQIRQGPCGLRSCRILRVTFCQAFERLLILFLILKEYYFLQQSLFVIRIRSGNLGELVQCFTASLQLQKLLGQEKARPHIVWTYVKQRLQVSNRLFVLVFLREQHG